MDFSHNTKREDLGVSVRNVMITYNIVTIRISVFISY